MDTLMGRYRNVSILAAAVFIQLIGLAYQIRRQTGTDAQDSSRLIRVWTISAITPLEKGIVRLQSGTSNLWRNYVYLRGVRQENRDLKDRLERLQLEQVRLQQDASQARRLQALLGFKEQFINQTVAAQVIGSSGSEQSRTVYLDKGSDAGIKLGMPVISAEGIVGKVILVQPGASQVLLINDQTSGVGTILEKSRLQGVLKGRASGDLVLDKVMSEEDVKTGERVLTSGGDQIFPKGLPVGMIGEVKHGGEFLQVQVKPAAALNHLEEVLVITQRQEREPDKTAVRTMRAADILAQRLPQVPDKPAETETAHPESGTPAPKPATTPSAGIQVKPAAPAGTGTPQAAAHPGTSGSVPLASKPAQPKTPLPGTTTGNTTQPKTSPAAGAPLRTAPAGSVPLASQPAQSKTPLPGTTTGNTAQPKTPPAAGAPLRTAPAGTTVSKPNSAPTQTAPTSNTGDTPQ